VKITYEGKAMVLPSQAGGLDETIASLSDIMSKIDKMPLQQIGENVNKLLVTTNGTIGDPAVKQSLTSLAATLKAANQTLSTVNDTYGNDSDFERSLQQVLDEANETLRSIKILSDYLNQHPQSLLLGRSGP